MEVKAKVRFIRMSPRKIRLVVDLIRGLPVLQAQTQLQFTNKAAALPVRKLLESAMANAEHNFNLKTESLFIKKISVDGGPIVHRWRPRAFGRAGAIRKRTSHINLILDEIATKSVQPAPVAKPIKSKAPKAPATKTAKPKAASTKKASTKTDK
ncbi:50S ribosomal protein L22 [Patescibacteria group bacterium]|nr:50S ribosomal protein L22 [Patescibacteria group bacterium]MBU1705859.1 50S ribosomal protein L22 [Patescibacteria group bacterium]